MATVEQTTDTPTKEERQHFTSSFMTNLDKEEAEIDKELDELIAIRQGKEPEDDSAESGDGEELTKEEETWKSRYGDLRRHNQKQLDGHKAEVDTVKADMAKLRGQLEKAPELPQSEAEVEEFIKTNPDVAHIFKKMIVQEMAGKQEEIDEKLEKMENERRKNAEENAHAKLILKHPNLSTLQESDEFHAWVKALPQIMIDALYNNNEDWESASRVIDLYKAEHEAPKKRKSAKSEDSRAAAESTEPGQRASEPTKPEGKSKPKYTESIVEKMKLEDYEANEEAIHEAMQDPAFYDLRRSGAR